VTTVHRLQIVDGDRLPMQRHDWPLDWIVTPETAISTHTPYPHPTGLDWAALQPDQLCKIPALQLLRQQRQFPPDDE
jgi:5-formyltetrahydrofolate cyclo-ligase